MSNTIIQIKRSSSTATPTNGSLSSAELAYSFSSNTLFIGSSDGSTVYTIGGKYFTDLSIYSAQTSNSAFGRANDIFAASNVVSNMANGAFGQANAAYGVANTALQQSGGYITGDLSVSGNLTITGQTTYANTQTLLVGDNIFVLNADLPNTEAPVVNAGMEINRGSESNTSIIWDEGLNAWTFTNDGSIYTKIASNTEVEVLAIAANAWSNLVSSSSNAWANLVSAASNTWANTVGSSANSYMETYASNADNIDIGTLLVNYGGTGRNSFTENGILFGNTTGALKVTVAGTEGQVLQASSTGVPQFGMLDGGNF